LLNLKINYPGRFLHLSIFVDFRSYSMPFMENGQAEVTGRNHHDIWKRLYCQIL